MSSTATKEAGNQGGSPTGSDVKITHTPMSERQQLALIKKLEKANAAAARLTINDGKNYES